MGNGGIARLFLTSVLDGGEWSTSIPGRFTPGERALGTHWIEGWMGPRAGVEAMEKRKISCPCQESKPGRSVRSSWLHRLRYPDYLLLPIVGN
jgi:hypothetical protein